MPSAKQQPPNIKHDVGIRPNVCKLTFGPPCTLKKFKIESKMLVAHGRKNQNVGTFLDKSKRDLKSKIHRNPHAYRS